MNSDQTSPGCGPAPALPGTPLQGASLPPRDHSARGAGISCLTRLLCQNHLQETVYHPPCSTVGLRQQNLAQRRVGRGAGPHYSLLQMWLPRGQRWETRAHLPCADVAGFHLCALGQVTHTPPMPGPPLPLGTVRRVSRGPDKVSGNSGELEELGVLVWGPGAPHCAIPPTRSPGPSQPRAGAAPRYPSLRAASGMPPLDLC